MFSYSNYISYTKKYELNFYFQCVKITVTKGTKILKQKYPLLAAVDRAATGMLNYAQSLDESCIFGWH